MNTSEPNGMRVSGSLRPAFEEPPRAPPSKRPGTGTFNRMQAGEPPAPPPAAAVLVPPVVVPTVRRRWRPSGFVFPLLVAAAGLGAAWFMWQMAGSVPLAVVCAGVGVCGAVFCHVLLRDRVEILERS
jgi:hypothetical protein